MASIFCRITFTGSCKTRSTNGNCCVFPFIYRGKRYNRCTRANSRRLWCANTPNYDTDKMFGYCRGTGKRMFSFIFECLVLVLQLLRVVRTVLSLNSQEWFSHEGTEWKIHLRYRHKLKFESCTTSFGRSSDNCTKERAPRAARLFFPHSNNDITHLLHCCCLNSLLTVFTIP